MSKVDDWTLTQALLSSNIKQPVFSLKKWDIIKTQYIQYINTKKPTLENTTNTYQFMKIITNDHEFEYHY